jgi:hypothetical protein
MNYQNSIQEWASSLSQAKASELSTTYLIGASSHKIELSNRTKGAKFLSSILYLLQENLSGVQMCPWATASCKEVCLGTHSGRAAMVEKGAKTNVVQVARLKRTLLFAKHRETFMVALRKELTALVKKAEKKGVNPAFRFNGTSDFPIETLGLMEEFPMIQFYDYTKSENRMLKFLTGRLPKNYHLTFSYTPENENAARSVLALGGNVAVVFNEKTTKVKGERQLPSFVGSRFLGHEIVDGDLHDLRFDDPQGGYVVGLCRKGHQKDMAFYVNLENVVDNSTVAV